DVITVHGNPLDVSWAGQSPWRQINTVLVTTWDLAFGEFDAVPGVDVLATTDAEWDIASGGLGPWKTFAILTQRAPELRFGDFNGDGKPDAFGVVDGMWQFVPGGGVLPPWWTPLQPSPTRDTAGLVVGDFDGDGISDVARRSATSWDVSRNARDPFVSR